MYWPILLAVASDVVYQIAAKSTPHDLNPFASLTITYLIGAAASAIIYFIMSRGGNIFHEWGQINWAVFILGIAIVGLEAGAIYMYRAGWNINTGYIVKACFIALALLIVGYLLYREELSVTKVSGIVICMIGLFLINR